MKKLTVLSAVLLCGLLLASNAMAIPYKYVSKPHAAIVSAGTTIDAIYVGDNVKVSDVRVGIYAKVVMYGSLYITLTSPTGQQVVIKQATAGGAAVPLYGFLGTERSYALFMDCDPAATNPPAAQPNDKVSAPATPLSNLNGKSSAGYWTLTIVDERNYAAGAQPQSGYLEAWALTFNKEIKETPKPFSPAVDIRRQGGVNLIGQINGLNGVGKSQIPNGTGALSGLQCMGTPPNPNGSLGVNGDCFPVVISGHPGAIIGSAAAGYPAGRFVITVSVRTNYPASGLFNAYTSDIAMFFGKAPNYAGSLPAPPGAPVLVNSPWPQGPDPVGTPAHRTTSLLGGTSPAVGGIKLAACVTPIADPMGNNPDDGGYDITFDDYSSDAITVGTTAAAPGGGIYGTYRPMQQMQFPAGTAVDGLYYLTVYDCFGEGGTKGTLVVTDLRVEYVVGGGNLPDPKRHQGIAGPLQGVPVPGTFTGAPLGYLSDVVGTIPPYSIHAKDQDPILAMWAMQKMYPMSAVGFERIQSMQVGGYTPPEGVRYDGPYAYDHPLNALLVPTENRSQATIAVNADDITIPTGLYKFRTNLVQARYDDFSGDNEIDSKQFEVTNTSMGYYGNQIPYWSDFQNPQGAALIASATMTAGTGIGVSFALMKNPATNLTSIDYKFDKGLTVTPHGRVRLSVWKTSGWLNGAPTTLVARSMNVEYNSYIEANWRSFPIYTVSAGSPIDPVSGQPTASTPGVSLIQGVYVVTLDNVGGAPAPSTNTVLIYPYEYPMVPGIKDRFCAGTTPGGYYFNDLFGPLGPYSTLGTRLGYLSTNVANPPSVAWGGGSSGPEFSATTFPIRLNMTTLNDFAINYVRFSGVNGNESIGLSSAPFVPTVNITANSGQGGASKDFNIRLEIFDTGNNRVFISDKVQYINGWQTVNTTMDSWSPGQGGIFKVKASFSRCPDDQNPVNNTLETYFYVNPSLVRAIVISGDNAKQTDVNALADYLKTQGLTPQFVDASDVNIANGEAASIYVVGSVTPDLKSRISEAVAQGSTVAFAYNPSAKIGSTLKNIDNVFEIDRSKAVNYDNVELGAPVTVRPGYEAPADVRPMAMEIKSKEDIVNMIRSNSFKIEAVEPEQTTPLTETAFANVLPVAVNSPYGEMTYISCGSENIRIVYALPEFKKAGTVRTDATAPGAFALEQNYPNPFNPTTVISYTLPQASVVTLRVMDLLGREVMTLVNQKQDAGTFTVTWKGLDQSGKEVSTGTYFYRIDAVPTNGGAAFSSMKKMTLTK